MCYVRVLMSLLALTQVLLATSSLTEAFQLPVAHIFRVT